MKKKSRKMKKPQKPSVAERFRKWDSENSDLLSDVMEHDDTRERQRIFASKRGELWEPRPVPAIEDFELKTYRRLYPILVVLLCVVLIAVLLTTVGSMPLYGSADAPGVNEVEERYLNDGMEETGAVNLVSGIILDYRAFDTLGESHVLFTAVCAVLILLLDDKHILGPAGRELESDGILRVAVSILFPVILMFGIYIIFNGHLSPGGGFSGGAIIGADLILYTITFGYKKTQRFMNRRVFRVITVSSLVFYAAAKGYSFFMGANGLESGINAGTPGRIFSAGLILPLNIAVGLVVACTMYGFYSVFRRGRI